MASVTRARYPPGGQTGHRPSGPQFAAPSLRAWLRWPVDRQALHLVAASLSLRGLRSAEALEHDAAGSGKHHPRRRCGGANHRRPRQCHRALGQVRHQPRLGPHDSCDKHNVDAQRQDREQGLDLLTHGRARLPDLGVGGGLGGSLGRLGLGGPLRRAVLLRRHALRDRLAGRRGRGAGRASGLRGRHPRCLVVGGAGRRRVEGSAEC
mmetsp:Transcript_71154/g.183469  ORF Transcript_71154/g.183469 Transcript_71154/m.183469 type:complete len:208 (+) Transcript_71154:311-934(+)